jgi:diguanylate cyclase (GGDEF)-like protein/PAS domain S-box-containing protein
VAALCVLAAVAMFGGALALGVQQFQGWHRWTHLVLLAITLLGLGSLLLSRWPAMPGRWLVVAAFAGQALAQMMAAIDPMAGADWPTLSLADAGQVVWGAGLAAFLVLQLRRRGRLAAAVHLLDAALITLAAIFVLWEWVIEPALGDPTRLGLLQQVMVVVWPTVDLYVASVLLLLLLERFDMARAVWFAAMILLVVADVAESRIGGSPTAGSLTVATIGWALGIAGLAAAMALRPVDDGVSRPPRLARLLVLNGSVTLALWTATWKYMVHHHDAGVASLTIGAVAGLVFAAAQTANFRQSASWARQLHDNLDEVEHAHEQLRAQLDDLPEAVVVIDRTGRIREVNARTLDFTGGTQQALVGRWFADLFRVEDRGRLVELGRALHSDVPISPPLLTLDTPDGREVVLEADVNRPVQNPDRTVVALRDVTGRVLESRRLERARERFRLAFHNAPTGMALSSVGDGTIIDVNDSLERMLDRQRETLVGATMDDICHPDERGALAPLMERVSDNEGDGFRVERRFLRGDGGTVWTRTWVSLMDDGEGSTIAISHIEDITEQRHTAERMEWAATHDGLTGLPNRFRFLERLGGYVETDEPGSVAVLFIDIDNFKVINDSLGHDAGDQLLRVLSERLRSVVRDRDMLGRFGGDEFIVMVRDATGGLDPVAIAERLRAEIAKPIEIDGAELFVTASIGITVADRVGLGTAELLRDADAAMYRAKSRGRDCVEVFSPATHGNSVINLRTANELRRGLERGEIVPYYQPVVMLDTGRLVGFEVLARWRHPDRGLLGADKFLPMAEETGLISDVGAAVLRASLAQLGTWLHSGRVAGDLSMAVNLSARQLGDADLVDIVAEALAQSGVPAHLLWLEITETALMADVKAATVRLRELRNLGLHLAVDDFGTGYSSLTYLKRFPVEAIKVDRSFVSGLGIDAEDTTIVEAVVKLGHSLGLQVVAEGVETPLQLSRLREIGCEHAQGYLFGRPRPAELVEAEYSLV